MKKTILMLSAVAMVLASCNKAEKTDASEPTAEVAVSTPQEDAVATSNAPMTSLALSENHWDFKDVKKGESVEHIYEVTNTGNNPLIISMVKPACGCTAPDYTKEPIMPGQKGQITLRFDSSSFDGLQNKQAEVYANVETAPIVLTFSANVVQ